MKIYDRGDTAYFVILHDTYTLATNAWAKADADSGFPKITIIDPNGDKILLASPSYEAPMTKKATGKYEYLYTIASDALVGMWTGYIDVENSAYPDRKHFSFRIKN